MAVGTSVPAEGASVEESEAEKAVVPAGEGEGPEEATVDNEIPEVLDSDRPQAAAETEAAAPQVRVPLKGLPVKPWLLVLGGDLMTLSCGLGL